MKIKKKYIIGLSLLISGPSLALTSFEAVVERTEWAHKCGYISDKNKERYLNGEYYPYFLSQDYIEYRSQFKVDLDTPVSRNAECNHEQFSSREMLEEYYQFPIRDCSKIRYTALKTGHITEEEYVELINSQTSFDNLDDLTQVHCPSSYNGELQIYGTGNPKASLAKLHQLANQGQMEASYILGSSYSIYHNENTEGHLITYDDLTNWYRQAASQGHKLSAITYNIRVNKRKNPNYTTLFSSVGHMTLPSALITPTSVGAK